MRHVREAVHVRSGHAEKAAGDLEILLQHRGRLDAGDARRHGQAYHVARQLLAITMTCLTDLPLPLSAFMASGAMRCTFRTVARQAMAIAIDGLPILELLVE